MTDVYGAHQYAVWAAAGAVALALLGGLIAFGIGHKRWSWGTVAAAFLVLLAATGYLYVAARFVDFEWRRALVLRKYRVDIARMRDATAPNERAGGRMEEVPDMDSLAELARKRDRWQRLLGRINNWQTGYWKNASFRPPRKDGDTGTLELPATVIEAAPDPGAAEPAPGEAAPAEPAPAEPAPAEPGPAPAEPAAPAEAPAEPAPAAPAADGAAAEPVAEAAAAAAEAPADPPAVVEPAPAGAAGAPAPGVVAPPADPGTVLYVFEDGNSGVYVGAFRVQGAVLDQASKRWVLTVVQTEPRDAYDAKAWERDYDAVTVYQELPSDRWLAFSRTNPEDVNRADAENALPEPRKLAGGAERVLDEVLTEADLLKRFRAELERHETVPEEVTDKEAWVAIRRGLDRRLEGQAGDEAGGAAGPLPGEYWATVEFKVPHSLGKDAADEAAGRSFAEGERADFDLQTAFGLQDDGKAEIHKVFYRRPLRDARTLMHGGLLAGQAGAAEPAGAGIRADGVAELVRVLEGEIRRLEASSRELADAQKNVTAELNGARQLDRELTADMKSWQRDAEVAQRVADAFARELAQRRKALEETEREIVLRGRELTAAIATLTAAIEREVAPEAARPQGAPAGQTP